MFTYCLYCETVKCGYVARAAELQFPCRAIYPKQVQHIWSKGEAQDLVHDLLPGYVFLYFEEEWLDISRLRAIDGVIRCLRDQDKRYALSGGDEQFALMLLEKDGVIGKTKVYQEGQLIRLCEGAYKGVETRILKVNRRNMRMQIEIPFAGHSVKTWVEYEVVEEAEAGEDVQKT